MRNAVGVLFWLLFLFPREGMDPFPHTWAGEESLPNYEEWVGKGDITPSGGSTVAPQIP